MLSPLGVIILAGGRGTRMGGVDKAQVTRHGRRFLDILTDNLHQLAPAAHAVVVSPYKLDFPGTVVSEDPAFGGPVAGISAGLGHLPEPYIAVLAVDAPDSPALLPHLAAALAPTTDVALVRDSTGRLQPLCALWRRASLVTALDALDTPRDKPVRALLDSQNNIAIIPGTGAERDYDYPRDVVS